MNSKKYSILLVDDDPAIIELLSLRLSILNYEVCCAENGKIALQKIDEMVPDLVMTDIKMPVMDGLTLIRNIRKTLESLPIIVLSGHLSEESIKECNDLGTERIFFKPFDNFNLIKSAIQTALNL